MGAAVAAVAIMLAAVPTLARGGLTFGFDLGAATVSGDTAVGLKGDPCVNYCDDQVRTDAGSGFAFGMHFGYNVLGYGGPEMQVFGHGNKDSGKGKWEGTGDGAVVAKVFPLQFFKELAARKYDPSLYFGYGVVTYNGYHMKINGDGRGWSGTGLEFGAACDYDVGRGVSVGLDLRFFRPSYNEYIYNFDDDITFEPKGGTATALVFLPLATVTFHMLDPEER